MGGGLGGVVFMVVSAGFLRDTTRYALVANADLATAAPRAGGGHPSIRRRSGLVLCDGTGSRRTEYVAQ